MNRARSLVTAAGVIPLVDRTAGRRNDGLDATARRKAAPASRALATTVGPATLVVPGSLRRAAGVIGELLALVAIVFCFPVVILAIGIPVALFVRLLLWVGSVL
jgi:hypothetical protein